MNVGNAYPFYLYNSLCIVLAITLIRYLFLLKYHFIVERKWIKVLFIFIPIPIFLFLMDVLTEFQAFYDEVGIRNIMSELHHKTQSKLSNYIKNEMIFFWAAAFISNALIPVRMIISLWREINKGTH